MPDNNDPALSFRVGDKTTQIFFSETVPSFENRNGTVLFITDKNCARYLPENVLSIIIEPGEINKTFETVGMILDKAFSLKMDRSSLFVGLGGGVITDMTAFAASLYMRGASLALIPTSLLSMVDASFGGKTGIDYKQYKNSVGSFYPAETIYIVPKVLKTLPLSEKKNGLTEVLKSAMLDNGPLWKTINDGENPIYSEDENYLKMIISLTLSIKGSIVERDFRETGDRAFLNLGHTFGHALETLTDFKISHGEGVAYGIIRALQYGELIGITPTDYKEKVFETMKQLELIPSFKQKVIIPPAEEILNAMSMDKKRRDGILYVITQKGLGDTVRLKVEQEAVIKVLGLPFP